MSREAMTLALEALETLARYENPETKIQNRKKDGGPIVTIYPHKVASDAAQLLRAALDARPIWFGLTTQEILDIVDDHTEKVGGLPMLYRDQAVDLSRAIEAKLRDKNV